MQSLIVEGYLIRGEYVSAVTGTLTYENGQADQAHSTTRCPIPKSVIYAWAVIANCGGLFQLAYSVRDILVAHRTALEELAKLLLEKEVVDRPALQAILKVRSIDSLKEKRRAADVCESESYQSNAERE